MMRLSPGLLLVALGIVGCAEEGPPLYHVSGTVSYEGKPVAVGSMVFQPDPSAGNSGPYGHAMIRDGLYDTRLEGAPTTGGAQIVMIEAFDGKVVNPEYAPYGTSLGLGYQETHVLPESEDAVLHFELKEE